MSRLLIRDALIINEGERYKGAVVVNGGRIEQIVKGESPHDFQGQVIEAEGLWLLPGVIDDQVHFREPGLTHKGDIHSESMAAVAGGITSYMEMPNTVPPATTIELLEEKFAIAEQNSFANYSFYLGATNGNIGEIGKIDPKRVCGVKVFMGSSTGNMLVDDATMLERIFAESPVPIATHCEEESIIKYNLEQYKAAYGENITPAMHPLIRSAEACYVSTAKAVELADKRGADLHVLHLSTERELALFDAKKPLNEKKITNEVCVHHLWFSDADYADKGNFIKWNPAIKTLADRDALRTAVNTGKIDVVATDHAPHTYEEKSRAYLSAPSGGPLVQHSLATMLELAKEGVYSAEKVVEKMAHAPAVRFKIKERGFIREGYHADLVLVDPAAEWEVNKANILYKCGWSPLEGVRFSSKVALTIIGGRIVYKYGEIDRSFRGTALEFDR